jgi:protein-S-isoprenylcysteine O-methyltransferase
MHPVLGGPNSSAATLNLIALVAIGFSDSLAFRVWGGADASREQDRGTFRWIVVVQLAAFAAAIAAAIELPAFELPGLWQIWSGIGLTLAAAGVALRTWAIATLGRSFRRTVVVDAGQSVIAAGPYRTVRHPSYTGILLAFAGFALALDNLLAAGLVIVPTAAVYVRRIRVEEAELLRSLPGYTQFAAGRNRLIPRVW